MNRDVSTANGETATPVTGRTTGAESTCKMDSNFESDVGDLHQIGAKRRRPTVDKRKRRRADPRNYVSYATQEHEDGEACVLNNGSAVRRMTVMDIADDGSSGDDYDSDQDEEEGVLEVDITEEDENLPLSMYGRKKPRKNGNYGRGGVDTIRNEESCQREKEPTFTSSEEGTNGDGDSGSKGFVESRRKQHRRQAKKLYPTSLMNFMCTSGKDKSTLQLKNIRMKQVKDIDYVKRKKLVRIVKNMLLKVSESFLPNDAKGLLAAAMREISVDEHYGNIFMRGMQYAKRSSLEKRLLRCVAVGNMKREDALSVIKDDVEEIWKSGEDIEEELEDGEEEEISRSISRGEEDVSDDIDKEGRMDDRNGDIECNCKFSGNVRRLYDRAMNDWVYYREYGKLSIKTRKLVRVTEEAVEHCVTFIYGDRFRQLMAHGMKPIHLQDGRCIDIPKVRRKMSKRAIVREYLNAKKEAGIRGVGSTMVMQLLRKVTSGQQKMKHCIDYCIGVLLLENIKNLESMVSRCVPEGETKKKLEKQCGAICDYFKHEYETHLNIDNDVAHNCQRALIGCRIRGIPEEEVVAMSHTATERRAWSKCDTFLKPFQFVEDLGVEVRKNNVTEEGKEKYAGVEVVLNDAADKFKLYMGHKLRCHVQHLEFGEAQQDMIRAEPETFAIVTMDYKMKYQPGMYREKSTDWYGQKGLSWHGGVVTYRTDRDKTQNSEGNEVHLRNIYLDHVCGNSTDQNAYSVCTILELICRKVREEVPTIKEVIIACDNASTYANNMMPVFAPFI